MTVRSLFSLAAAVGLGLASATYAQPSLTNNQKLADDVATRIGNSGVAGGAKVDVQVKNGTVELTGEVLSERQAQMVSQQAEGVPGVVKVETKFKLAKGADIRPVQGEQQPMLVAPSINSYGAGPGMHGPQDPTPLAAPGGPNFDAGGPRMPPYAWPTYAPYNNMSRVAYPQAYPHSAFPFIGPYYPFPKVPLGWRSVKLEWDDGHWYMGRLSTPYDYWKVRFW